MEIEKVCPLGSECQKAVDGKIVQCAWYIELQGKNPQTGEDINDAGCAIAWQPILMLEQARQIRSVASATETTTSVLDKATRERLKLDKKIHGITGE